MCGSKVVAACIFNELQAVGLFLTLDGASMRTNHFTSGKKYRKLAVFIRNESLFFVSAAAICAFQLERGCYAAYAPRAMRYGLSNMGKY